MAPGTPYLFGEDSSHEEERLAAVERAFDPMTQSALLGVGARPGWRCWEVGAGRGSIARWLAGVVAPGGAVLATDLDAERFEHGSTNVRFLQHDVTVDPLPAGSFDLIHARFLLEHVAEPQRALERLRDALRPGGVLVVEDASGLQIDTSPASSVFGKLAVAWERAGLAVGWDATYGRGLVSQLRAARLRDLEACEYRRTAPGGKRWAHLQHGLERLRDQLIDQAVAPAELQEALRFLLDEEALITSPPVVIAWGRR
jgi:SAM-dependent methyltransferase